MKSFGILLRILTSVYFALRGRKNLKDFSLHKDLKYIQVYIVPYQPLGVTGIRIQSYNLRHSRSLHGAVAV